MAGVLYVRSGQRATAYGLMLVGAAARFVQGAAQTGNVSGAGEAFAVPPVATPHVKSTSAAAAVSLLDGVTSEGRQGISTAAFWSASEAIAASGILAWWRLVSTLAALILPFVAFQKKLLPEELARVVARLYFWPTVPLTILKSWSKGKGLWCAIDDTVVLGMAPVCPGQPGILHTLGVRAVVNLTTEYAGPTKKYRQLELEQLHLPTVDHHEPSLAYLVRAVKFIEERRLRGHRVYVHCKAGHGRAGAVALAWLCYSRGQTSAEDLAALNGELLSKRHVRPRLHLQPNVRAFAAWVEQQRQASDRGHGENPRELAPVSSEQQVRATNDFASERSGCRTSGQLRLCGSNNSRGRPLICGLLQQCTLL